MEKRNTIGQMRRTWFYVVLVVVSLSVTLYLSIPAAGSPIANAQLQDSAQVTQQTLEAQKTIESLMLTRDAILAQMTVSPQATGSATPPTPTATTRSSTNTPTPTRRATSAATAVTTASLEVLAAGVNIRSGPGTGFPVIASAQAGQRYTILGQYNNCTWLKIGQAQGQERWITGNAQFVRLLSPCSQAPAISLQAPTPVTPSTQPTPTPGRTAAIQPAPSTRLAGPTPLEPGDGAAFDSGSTIVLRWTPVKPALDANELYLVTITYRNKGAVWTDVAWSQETQWRLNEHSYLLGMSDDGVFNWSVRLLRQSGTDNKGVPTGDDLSISSPVRSLVWRAAAASGGSEGSGSKPPDPTRIPDRPD